MRRIGLIGVGAFAILALLALIYPAVIGLIYRNDLPSEWSGKLMGMTLGEIQERIGPPDEEASAKGFQNRIVRHWWGIQLLKVGSMSCQPEERPISIWYYVYVNGRYNPVVMKDMREALLK
jgi:hypothetical protein